ncbi:hypothetical protein FOZ63_011581, partial [Perkinsus olseni]
EHRPPPQQQHLLRHSRSLLTQQHGFEDDSPEEIITKRYGSRRPWAALLAFTYVCWLVFQYYATWVAVTCPRRDLRQWGWPLALLPTAPCLYYAVQLGYNRSFFKAFLAAFGLYPLFLCLKSLSRCKDSHKFEEVQVVYGGMSIMPSLALYGSILVSVETPYSRIQGNGFRYYSLPGPLGSWSAEWMQYRVDPQVVLDEESLRRASLWGIFLSAFFVGVLLARSEVDKSISPKSIMRQIMSLLYYSCSACARTTLVVLFLSSGPSRRIAPWNGYCVLLSMAVAVILCAFSFSRARSQSGAAISGLAGLGCWWTSWRAVNAFDAEEWDASYSLLEFLSQLWGWENVIVLAVCYITDQSNILVVLSCLGGFVLERLLRECLDLTTLKNNTREEGARTDNPPLTEALLSA